MKSERFGERAPPKDAFPRNEFHFSNSIFGPRKELPARNGDRPSRRPPDRDGVRNWAAMDSHDVPLNRDTGSRIRAANWGKQGCRRSENRAVRKPVWATAP